MQILSWKFLVFSGFIVLCVFLFKTVRAMANKPVRYHEMRGKRPTVPKTPSSIVTKELSEPTLGDPTLASLGFGNELDLRENISKERNPTSQMTFVSSNTVAGKKSSSFASPPSILVLYVVAGEGRRFYGYELLQALLAAGLRYGEMSIFHRYETQNEKEIALFSVASATEPGVFDLNKIGSFFCTGLSLFMKIKKPAQPVTTFETMLETAKQLADDLNGEVFDDQRQLLTPLKIEEYRECFY